MGVRPNEEEAVRVTVNEDRETRDNGGGVLYNHPDRHRVGDVVISYYPLGGPVSQRTILEIRMSGAYESDIGVRLSNLPGEGYPAWLAGSWAIPVGAPASDRHNPGEGP